tara:strand:- start:764 stop:868 length:105 start_codon:yes stop_codon:yes gene_type:complete
MSKTNLQEKISIAKKRIDELLLLIAHWKKQDEAK